MTYNIHSGFGWRGRHNLDTVLEVISPEQADLVALQEVDFALRRSGYVNQAQWLAERLGMHAIIGATRRQGRYGNALLTRWATTFVMNHNLTVRPHPGRACLEVHLATPNGTLRCYVTHLGLVPQERMAQVRRLTREIIATGGSHEPALFMGDMNTVSRSRVSRVLRRRFTDAFKVAGNGSGCDLPRAPTGGAGRLYLCRRSDADRGSCCRDTLVRQGIGSPPARRGLASRFQREAPIIRRRGHIDQVFL